MTLTKKHFIKIAKILKESNADNQLIQKFVDFFREENPKFDRERFINACDYITGEGFKNEKVAQSNVLA